MALGLKKYQHLLRNKYILILFVFAVWMFFIDANSWFTHYELNQEIEELENNMEYYRKEIAKDQEKIKNLKDPTGLEKFARETYFMKKETEDIFIIEYQDSIQP